MKEPTPLSNILHTFFNRQFTPSHQQFLLDLWKVWPQLTTTETLKQTRPIYYQNKNLTLWVAHSSDLQEISFHVIELKDKINQHFKKEWVKGIRFTVNKDLLKAKEKTIKILKNLQI